MKKTKERMMLILLAAINFTHIMDFMIMMPLGNYLMPHFEISPQAFSWLVAAYTDTAAVSGFLAAFFVDRFDRKKVLLVGYSGFVLGTLCCALSPSYELLLASRIVAGLFGGLIGAQVLSIVSDSVPYERRAAAMGIIMSAFSLASVFGVPFGLYLATHLSWHMPFYVVAGMGLVLIPLTIRILPPMTGHLHPEGKDKRPSGMEILKGVASDRNQRMALALAASLMLGHFMIIPFLNPFMEFNMGFSKNQTMFVYMVGGALTFFTSPLIGRVADKAGKFRLFALMAVLGLLPVAFITNMPKLPLALVLCVTGFWFVVSSGRSIPAQAMISNVVPPERRGGFMSFNSSIQQLFTGTASLLAGYMVNKAEDGRILHYEWTGYVSIAVIAFSIVLAYRLNKALDKKKEAATEKMLNVEL